MTNEAIDGSSEAVNTPVTETEANFDTADTTVPVIHDIASAPVIAQATPKAVAMTAVTDTALPHTQSLDLAAEVLDYLTNPAIRSPDPRS